MHLKTFIVCHLWNHLRVNRVRYILTEDEYSLIEDKVNQAYLIFNEREGSHFEKVMPCELFEKYKETLN